MLKKRKVMRIPRRKQSTSLVESIENEVEQLEKFEINPNFYAHIVITQTIKSPHLAFINGNREAGLTSLIFGVDQLERICKANKMLPKNYDEDVEKEIEKLTDKEGLMRQAKEANIKMQFLLGSVFSHRKHRVTPII